MSIEHETTPAPSPAAERTPQRAPGAPNAMRQSVRTMSYREGAAALSPVQLHPDEAHDHSDSVEPAPGDTVPGDLDTARPVGGDIPADIKTRIMGQMRLSPRIATVLDEIAAHGGADFPLRWSARGNYHSAGSINLDRRGAIASWIPSMMHELNHLNDHRQGRRPNLTTSTDRAAFVRSKMTNEIRAHAIGYVGLIEQSGREGAVTANAPKGYTAFRTHLTALEGRAEACFTSSRIQQVAETWLEDKYRNDASWQTSNTHENYYDYWGRIWDEAHPSGG